MKLNSALFIISIIFSNILISCNNKEKQPNSPPEIEKIDPKTYSTNKDIWIADTKATCEGKEITTNPNLTYGIDLSENYYWEVNREITDESICYTRHLYSIATTGYESHCLNLLTCAPTYNLKGVLVPQLLRIKCMDSKTNAVISDT